MLPAPRHILKGGLLLLFFAMIAAPRLSAQTPKKEPTTTRILFIMDASQSMNAMWETGRKIDVAKKLMIRMIDSLEGLPDVLLGLRLYGHQSPVPPQDCNDSRLEVPIMPGNAPKIRQKLRFIEPRGTTPIARSLELSARDFPECDNCRNIVILITDGVEACDGDPCAVSLALQKAGIFLKPFIIGVGLDLNFRKTFECAGHYYDASNESKFKEALGVVISQALNSTTAQVNLLDSGGQPTETNVGMTFYDIVSGRMKYNMIHTLNHKGNPDTLVLDPLVTYRVEIHTLPPVKIDSLKLTPGKHTVVAVDAPQGTLLVKSAGAQHKNLDFSVRRTSDCQTINFQRINATENYLVGTYELEIPTRPPIRLRDVEINQSTTTTIEIPRPGMATFIMSAPGYGEVLLQNGNDLEWAGRLNTRGESETMVLQPGNYVVVFRSKNNKQSINSVSKSFRINSDSSSQVYLN